MKEYSGGGKFSARGLYEGKSEKKLCCTIVCECNKVPYFAEEPTPADVLRILDIYFSQRFVNNLEDVDESNNIFLGNARYKDEDWQEEHKTALIKILINAYNCYKHRGRVFIVPNSIKNRTNLYLQMSSNIYTWIDKEYVKTNNIKDLIKIKICLKNLKRVNIIIIYLELKKINITISHLSEKYLRMYF